MHSSDTDVEVLCFISNSKTGYIIQKVVNKAGDTMYVACESNNPLDEVYSCYRDELGNMLEHLVTVSLAKDGSY